MASSVCSMRPRWAGIDAHHLGVGRQRARAAAQDVGPAYVVEQHDAVGHHQRVVVRQAGDARPSRMWRGSAAPMKSSGEAMVSQPAEWCSPNQASS